MTNFDCTNPKILISRNFQGTSFAGPQVEDGNICSWWMIDLGYDHQPSYRLTRSSNREGRLSDGLEENDAAAMQMGGGIDDDVMEEADEGMALDVQDIDTYWLQRKISQAYKQQIDPQRSRKVAEDVLEILAESCRRL
nr:DExH-box ATP-dependent RNA helicase DExH12-like [Ipomoea batatas]